MNRIMPLDALSSIKEAKPSKAVEELFEKVKSAINEIEENATSSYTLTIDVEVLREDVVKECDKDVIMIIRQNFPMQKAGYLVVPRVIDE